MEYIDSKTSQHFIPEQYNSVSENVIECKDKVNSITYNSIKLIKWHIRLYVLADSKMNYQNLTTYI